MTKLRQKESIDKQRSSGQRDPIGGVIRCGLMVVLAFAPLAFGAVHTWAYGFVWAVIWFLVAIWGTRAWLSRDKSPDGSKIRWVRAPFQPLMTLFGLWILLQCLPLPASWVGWIQPETLEARRLAEPLAGRIQAFVPLTLYPHATRVGIFNLWSYGALFYLSLYHLKTRRHILRMATLWIVLGTFQALYGLMEYLGGTDRIWWWIKPYATGVTGTFINQDHLAGYLEMTVMVALGFLIAMRAEMVGNAHLGWRGKLSRIARDDRWARALLVFFLCVLMGAALLLSLSRGGASTLTAVILPVSVMLVLRKATRRYGLLGLAFFIGMILYAAPLGLGSLFESFTRWQADFGVRQELWGSSWEMTRAFPWIGSGWGSFEWVYPRFKVPRFGETVVAHAHNDWVELCAEAGFVGTALVVTAVFLYLVAGARAWRSRRDHWGIWLGFGALGAVVIMVAHGFGEFLLHTQANALTLAAIMAWGWVALHHHKRGPNREFLSWPLREIKIPKWIGRLGMALLAFFHVIIGIGMAQHLLAEFAVPTERNSTVQRKEIRDLDLLRSAIDLEAGNAVRWAWTAREVMYQGVTQDLEVWARGRGVEPEGETGEIASWARAFLRRAIRLNPTNPQFYEQLGWVLSVNPEWRKEGSAEYALRTAVRLEPANSMRHFHLAQYFLLVGRPREAQEAYEEAVRLAPDLKSRFKKSWPQFQKTKPEG